MRGRLRCWSSHSPHGWPPGVRSWRFRGGMAGASSAPRRICAAWTNSWPLSGGTPAAMAA
eukprot:6943188-Alexandrium_andersonii.AAC.1